MAARRKTLIYREGDDVVLLQPIDWPQRLDYAFDHRRPRSVYALRINGVARGFIVYPHGYGKGHWTVYAWSPDQYGKRYQLSNTEGDALGAAISHFESVLNMLRFAR